MCVYTRSPCIRSKSTHTHKAAIQSIRCAIQTTSEQKQLAWYWDKHGMAWHRVPIFFCFLWKLIWNYLMLPKFFQNVCNSISRVLFRDVLLQLLLLRVTCRLSTVSVSARARTFIAIIRSVLFFRMFTFLDWFCFRATHTKKKSKFVIMNK